MRTHEQNKEKISPCCLNMNENPFHFHYRLLQKLKCRGKTPEKIKSTIKWKMEKTMRTDKQNKEKISPCCLNMNENSFHFHYRLLQKLKCRGKTSEKIKSAIKWKMEKTMRTDEHNKLMISPWCLNMNENPLHFDYRLLQKLKCRWKNSRKD